MIRVELAKSRDHNLLIYAPCEVVSKILFATIRVEAYPLPSVQTGLAKKAAKTGAEQRKLSENAQSGSSSSFALERTAKEERLGGKGESGKRW